MIAVIGGGESSYRFLYVALALFTDSSYAFLAGRLRRWLGGQVIQGPLPRYVSGVVYIGLGVSMELADRH